MTKKEHNWEREFDEAFTRRYWVGGKVNAEAFDGEMVNDIKDFIAKVSAQAYQEGKQEQSENHRHVFQFSHHAVEPNYQGIYANFWYVICPDCGELRNTETIEALKGLTQKDKDEDN